jgi:hypothetical protein
VRRESASAVCFWWGVTAQTVSKWRKEMGVAPMTEGTRRLKAANPGLPVAREQARGTLGDPERRRKIAASKVGKKRPWHVIEAMREGRLGMKHSEETKRKMSASHKLRARATEFRSG